LGLLGRQGIAVCAQARVLNQRGIVAVILRGGGSEPPGIERIHHDAGAQRCGHGAVELGVEIMREKAVRNQQEHAFTGLLRHSRDQATELG